MGLPKHYWPLSWSPYNKDHSILGAPDFFEHPIQGIWNHEESGAIMLVPLRGGGGYAPDRGHV